MEAELAAGVEAAEAGRKRKRPAAGGAEDGSEEEGKEDSNEWMAQGERALGGMLPAGGVCGRCAVQWAQRRCAIGDAAPGGALENNPIQLCRCGAAALRRCSVNPPQSPCCGSHCALPTVHQLCVLLCAADSQFEDDSFRCGPMLGLTVCCAVWYAESEFEDDEKDDGEEEQESRQLLGSKAKRTAVLERAMEAG